MNDAPFQCAQRFSPQAARSSFGMEAHQPAGTTAVRVTNLQSAATGVMRVELVPLGGQALDAVEAGAHVDVHLPNGLVRQYSLINDQESHRYVIAVGLDASSRGGSTFVHHGLKLDDTLRIGRPRNHFALHTSTVPAVLVAGGIGITPIWSMVQRLEREGRQWTLYYCARTPEHAAFLADIERLADASRVGRVVRHFDRLPGQVPLDLTGTLAAHEASHHFYCCGPKPMLDAFADAARVHGVPEDRIHIEHFNAAPIDASGDAPFEVETSDGTVHTVPMGRSILDVLLDAGENVLYSCKEGTCGTCETNVLEGEPLHRDAVLSAAERASHRTMMICVSRCKAGRLKLDI